jgi:hypothetical protein
MLVLLYWRVFLYVGIAILASGLYMLTLLYSGADLGFQVRGGALKKITPSGGKHEIFGVFRVKNHDFTPKNHVFKIAEGGAKIFGVFRVKNHDFTPKNHISSNFRGACAGCTSPGFTTDTGECS